MTNKNEVEAFVADARQLIESGRYFFVMRPKNKEALLALGMTRGAALKDIASLTARDYCGGPEDDRDRPKQVCWKFGLFKSTTEIYVKLVIETLPEGRRLKVLSYHQAERPLRYPLRMLPLGGAKS